MVIDTSEIFGNSAFNGRQWIDVMIIMKSIIHLIIAHTAFNSVIKQSLAESIVAE